MRKALTSHRSEIAALKREVKALASQLKGARRAIDAKHIPSAALEESPSEPRRTKSAFQPEVLAAKRAELGLSQKDMAKLLQASALSASKWESGKVQPRAAQLERIAIVLKMGKRAANAALGME